MLARARGAARLGIESRVIDVEVDATSGGARTVRLIGLGSSASRGMEQRLVSALRNSGLPVPDGPVTANFAPASLPKEGPPLDLALAAAVLGSLGVLARQSLRGVMLHGELSLDGAIRPVAGALSAAEAARAAHVARFVCTPEASAEAAAVSGLRVHAARDLAEAVQILKAEHAKGEAPLDPSEWSPDSGDAPDLSDVRGQLHARRALEIAAAGGHGLLLVGPPGTGKSMLARRLPGVLPPLNLEEAIDVTRVHSAAGLLLAPGPHGRASATDDGDGEAADARREAARRACGLVTRRPFRAPHHSISSAGLLGGGRVVGPGEITLAHHGVLFLDELPEFRRDVLEGLRAPLEDGHVAIVRVGGRIELPCRAQLIAAMNPCPCGWYGSRRPCLCPDGAVHRYRRRLSGPLLDRLDLHVEVPALSFDELSSASLGEGSAAVSARVSAARDRQMARSGRLNARIGTADLRRLVRLSEPARRLLEHAVDRLGLTGRAHDRVLQVALTLHDLAERTTPPTRGRSAVLLEESEIGEALSYRMLDRPAVPGLASFITRAASARS